jgi:hypothetical protein
LQCFPSWELAFYFSASSYATVGYGDVILSDRSYKRECQEKNLPLGWVPIIFLSRHSAQLFERALSL